MKKSINAWSVDSQTNFDNMFSQIKTAGFDGIELNVDNKDTSAHSLTLETTEKELSDILSLSKKYDLPVVSISTSLWGGNMGSAKQDIRNWAEKLLEKQLICAKILGASGILAVPGGINSDVSIAEAYKNSFDTLESCKNIIADYKLKVGLENVWNTFFTSPYDMANFIDRLECEYISAYYDAGNVAAFSWPEYWIEILGSRISHVHIKDFKRGSGFNTGGIWSDLLQGDVNFRKIVPALEKAGFDGYLTAEITKSDDNQTFEDFYKETADIEKKIIVCNY